MVRNNTDNRPTHFNSDNNYYRPPNRLNHPRSYSSFRYNHDEPYYGVHNDMNYDERRDERYNRDTINYRNGRNDNNGRNYHNRRNDDNGRNDDSNGRNHYNRNNEDGNGQNEDGNGRNYYNRRNNNGNGRNNGYDHNNYTDYEMDIPPERRNEQSQSYRTDNYYPNSHQNKSPDSPVIRTRHNRHTRRHNRMRPNNHAQNRQNLYNHPNHPTRYQGGEEPPKEYHPDGSKNPYRTPDSYYTDDPLNYYTTPTITPKDESTKTFSDIIWKNNTFFDKNINGDGKPPPPPPPESKEPNEIIVFRSNFPPILPTGLSPTLPPTLPPTTPTNSKKNNPSKKLFTFFGLKPGQLPGETKENEEENTGSDIKEEDVKDSVVYEYECLLDSIACMDDLILIAEKYEEHYKDTHKLYNIDVQKLFKILEPLKELQQLVGLNKIKQQIYEQIVFYLQNLEDKNNDMLHTVIQGKPGVGKTELAKILGKIYTSLGILSKGTFKSVKRSDLVGGYLGQTAIKTQKVLDECDGGVLFIDEAYSLGNKEGRDSYSKECIDTLTSFLSEKKNNFVCIIAGYKTDLEECFFSYNEGLKRRFVYRYQIDDYSATELRQILINKIKIYNWKIVNEDDITIRFFEKNKEYFIYNGGDMETLFHKIKVAHSKRVLFLPPEEKKIINMEDLEKAMELFLNNDEIKNRKKENSIDLNMYL